MENKTTIQIDLSTKDLLDEIKVEIQDKEEKLNNKPIYENLDYNAVVWILANEFKENRK
jgi:hypothetical protein